MSEVDDLINQIQSGTMGAEKLKELQGKADSQLASYSNALALLQSTPEASFTFDIYRQALEAGSGTTSIGRLEWDQMLPYDRVKMRNMLIETVREGQANFERIKAALDAALGKSSSCFVATATVGPDSWEVRVLRDFRDKVLLRTSVGILLVAGYDCGGPPTARLIEKQDILRRLARWFLVRPLATIVKLAVRVERDA